MEATALELFLQALLAVLLLVLPGSALYLAVGQLFGDLGPQSLSHAPLYGLGLSIAVWPILLLYLTLTGGSLSAPLVWALLVVSGGYVVWRALTLWGWPAKIALRPYALALAALTLIALAFRLGDVLGLSLPLFGDSLHHTMVTKMIMEAGRLPGDWLPYVPMSTFTYHFGFHTYSVALAYAASSEAPQAVLVGGQVLNAAAVPAAYLLNRKLFGTRIAGLGAGLLTGFVSIMPAFYVNWGRYTQLAGHLLLAVSLAALLSIDSAGDVPGGRGRLRAWAAPALLAMCVAGLVVVHYRVLIFFGLFMVPLALWHLLDRSRSARVKLTVWGRVFAAVAAGLVLALPWLLRLATDYLPNLSRRLGSVTPEYLAAYNDPGSIRVFVGTLLPALAVVGVAVAIWRFMAPGGRSPGRQGDGGSDALAAGQALVVALWTLLLIGSLWVVPGAIGGYTIAITLYIPLAALGGYTLDQTLRRLAGPRLVSARQQTIVAVALVACAPIAALFSGTARIADPGKYSYVREPDLRAFDWIKQNTPQGSRFVISSEFSYAGRGLTATDSGMWLPLLAAGGRTVSIPASITGNERPFDPQFITDTRMLAAYTQPVGAPGQTEDSTQVNLIARGVITQAAFVTEPPSVDLMRKLNCRYIFVGSEGGAAQPRLDIRALRADEELFALRYFQDGVYVFELLR